MLTYLLRRLTYMVVVLFLVTLIGYFVIEIPPGDYITAYVSRLAESGARVDEEEEIALRKQYGLDLPVYLRYFTWMGRLLKGDFGMSFGFNKPVAQLLAERLPLTLFVSLFTVLFTYFAAIPIGIYSATHQYSLGDYAFTFIGFIGLATPNFLLALILMFLFFKYFGVSIGGLFSPQFAMAPWSLGKIMDLLQHMIAPIIVVGTAGTAGLIRVMRGCLLDELQKQYVITARSKGLSEKKLLFKYPVRVAINPIVSTVGWILPYLISGQTITAIVLSLPTMGSILYDALLTQDTYLAGSIMVILCSLVIIGTLLSDILLGWIDPRIRFEK